MLIRNTDRGFGIIEFFDGYRIPCSLQESSSAEENAIWLGTNPKNMTIFENDNMGKHIETPIPKTFMIKTRMHLSQKQVKELLPYLEYFVEHGELPVK